MPSFIRHETAARHAPAPIHNPQAATAAPQTSHGHKASRPSRPDHHRTAELLAQASTGDADAFAQAYDILVADVWAVTQTVVRDHGRAQSAAQRAFEEMWRTAPACPPETDAASAWAMGIAVRCAVLAATVHTEKVVQPAHTSLDSTAEPCEPVIGVRTRSEPERARRSLLGLPERQRDAILLALFGRLTIGQTARVLQVPAPQAAIALRDGLAHLGELLARGRRHD